MEDAKALHQQQQQQQHQQQQQILLQQQHQHHQQQQHYFMLQQLQKQQQQQQHQAGAISRFPSNIDAHLRPMRPLNLQQNPNPNPNTNNPILNLHQNPNSNNLQQQQSQPLQQQQQQQQQKAIRPGNQMELQMAYQDAWRVCHPDFKRPFSSLEDACERNGQENVKLNRSSKRFIDRGYDSDNLAMERAAFMDFGDANDVIGKSQFSHKEMEERIQKLARLLNGADIDFPEWMFSKMMRSAKIKFNDYSITRVIIILGNLGNWRRVIQVIQWLQRRERFKSHKLRHIYTAALDALRKSRRSVEALSVFHAMQQQMSTYPDLVAYHSVAVTLGQAGYMKELFDVIDIMRSPPKKNFKTGAFEKWDPRLEPDIVVYDAVVNACAKRKQWEGALWVLQQLKKQGQQPSATTYGLVMEVGSWL